MTFSSNVTIHVERTISYRDRWIDMCWVMPVVSKLVTATERYEKCYQGS